MIRRIDDLGRVVIPRELRQRLLIEAGDELVVQIEGTSIKITKYKNSCVYCSSEIVGCDYALKLLCDACVETLEAMRFGKRSSKKEE